MTSFRILLATWTLCCSCLAYPDIHKQMSAQQLQSIFHVEDIDSVPNYELVKLLHHTEHHIRRRSVDNRQEISAKEAHHVKKDLSKSPYYSEIKLTTDQHGGNSFSDHSLSDKIKNLDISHVKEHNVSFSAFGEVLNLNLKQTEGLFKDGPQSLRMWTVRSEPNATQGVEYDEVPEESRPEEHIGELFQDEDNMAAILMRRQLETGDLVMEGSIGHDIVIKPLPHELSPNKEETHHVVFKRSINPTEQLSDFAFMEPDRLEKRYRKRRSTSTSTNSSSSLERDHDDDDQKDDSSASSSTSKSRSKRGAPYTIYPEILAIVDYDGYRLHGGDNVQVKRYFVSFWNGVDLRYRLLKGPRIRISIAGIIISRGRDATPYLERNRVGRDAIDSAAALTDMGKYLFRERRLPVYDIAVAITKLDMCRRSYPYGECKRGTAGFAYVGGACVVNKRLEKVNSVAIIEDTGGFSGIIVAAHEVGHLLGAVHDGSPPPSYLGGPGAEKCRWEDGYIMSDLRHTERGFKWSPCTIQSFHHFLNGDTATCLHNAPHEDNALGRSLPGTLLSLDAQCRRDRGTYACFKDDRVCAQLFCFDSQTGYCVAYRPAAEGSSCGNGLHCLDGRCVAHHSNVIPSFNRHSSHSYRSGYRDDDDLDEPTTDSASSQKSTSTTTPTPQDNDYSPNVDNDPITTDKPQSSFDKSSLNDPPNDLSSTTARPSSANPPYNSGFTKYTGKPLNSFKGKTSVKYSSPSGPTRKPFDFQSFFHNKNRSSSNSPYSPTPLSDQLETSSSSPALEDDNSDSSEEEYKDEPETTTQRSYIFGGRSTSRNPLFESYLKKLSSTTRSPSFLENIGQYFRRTTTQPSYSSNILGDNSNNSPVNVSVSE